MHLYRVTSKDVRHDNAQSAGKRRPSCEAVWAEREPIALCGAVWVLELAMTVACLCGAPPRTQVLEHAMTVALLATTTPRRSARWAD